MFKVNVRTLFEPIFNHISLFVLVQTGDMFLYLANEFFIKCNNYRTAGSRIRTKTLYYHSC